MSVKCRLHVVCSLGSERPVKRGMSETWITIITKAVTESAMKNLEHVLLSAFQCLMIMSQCSLGMFLSVLLRSVLHGRNSWFVRFFFWRCIFCSPRSHYDARKHSSWGRCAVERERESEREFMFCGAYFGACSLAPLLNFRYVTTVLRIERVKQICSSVFFIS